jgi:hypothetical protein
MIRIPRFTRLAAVFVLMVSAFAVGMSPAGSEPAATGSATSTNDGTATITYSDTTDLEIYIIDGAGTCEDTGSAPSSGVLATMGVDAPVPVSPVTVTTATMVGPAPLHELGTGSFLFCMYDVVGGTYTYLNVANGTIGIFNLASGSLVDNGNGSLILTYDANMDFGQFVYLFLLSGASTCPTDPGEAYTSENPGYALQSGLVGLEPSPAVITVGTPAIPIPVGVEAIPELVPVAAGQYLACLMATTAEDVALLQSLPTQIAPPSEPVVPAFTG